MTSDIEDQLAAALHRLGDQADLHDLDPRGLRAKARHRRWMTVGPIAAVVAVLAVLAGLYVPRLAASDATPSSACGPLQTGPLPSWATAGFTGNSYPPFALSSSGQVAAIIFGNPLMAPPDTDRNNKILWVVDGVADGDLVITGQLEGSTLTTTVKTGALPGPSIIDMPAAGCWHLDLSYGSHHDSINLRWVAG